MQRIVDDAFVNKVREAMMRSDEGRIQGGHEGRESIGKEEQ